MNNFDKMEKDLVVAGFHRLDSRLIEKKPPTIQWGILYQQMTVANKINYLERLASSMNHAAHLIQAERDELNKLCELKEQQLSKMTEAMRANDAMLQSEVTRMNEERQAWNAAAAQLKAELRELKVVS